MRKKIVRIEKTRNPKDEKYFVLRFEDKPDKIYDSINALSKAWREYQDKGIRCSMKITRKVKR